MNYVSHWTWNVEYVDGVMEVSNFFTIILQKIIQKSLSSVVIAAKNFPPRIKRLGTWKNPILLSRVVILIGQSLFRPPSDGGLMIPQEQKNDVSWSD